MIIYLHGFRSAPASGKAQTLKKHMQSRGLGEYFWCEQLPSRPYSAIDLIESAIHQAQDSGAQPTLVGSSLGGYYAAWLSQKHDLRAVLINPAVVAPLSLEEWVGTQTNLYTGEAFEFTYEHIAQLEALEVAQLDRPENIWLLAETGDEVLDYRDAVEKYAGAEQTILPGGNHGFSRWNNFLDEVLSFAGLTSENRP